MESLGDTSDPDPPEKKPDPKPEIKNEPPKQTQATSSKLPDPSKSQESSPQKSQVRFEEQKKDIPINAASSIKEIKTVNKDSSFSSSTRVDTDVHYIN